MTASPLAGKPVPVEALVDVPALVRAYYTDKPDVEDPGQRVSFGTSGHRGTSLNKTFTEAHIAAISQAVCNFRRARKIDGPLFLGKDTHALSEPAHASTIEVLAANGVALRFAGGKGYTPTPVISHAILAWNRGRTDGLADGIVITPSHNPPTDGGFKYNPPSGGPADAATTAWIAAEANRLLRDGKRRIRRLPLTTALAAPTTVEYDYRTSYVEDLGNVLDMDRIREADLRIGADALGGSGLEYWGPIAERYGLDITVHNGIPDPTFRFMSVDHDGTVRMDCSSPWAMAGLIGLRERYDIAFGNDPDFDRHGIVTPAAGLMPPNHFLAVAVEYLFGSRSAWPKRAAVGKTLVSSGMIDRVAASLNRPLLEVPVGFKWFVEGLGAGQLGFGGEESAGASFLRRDGTVWTTDKDGIILALLAAEIRAVTGKDPADSYRSLEERFGRAVYARTDAPASPPRKRVLEQLTPDDVRADTLAGERIQAKLTVAPGNGAPLGGLKVTTENGWFAARPSGTEDIYKIYAESFLGEDHLARLQAEARDLVSDVFRRAGG